MIFLAHLTSSIHPNHWATEDTTIRLVENVILPHVTQIRMKAGNPDQHALVIIDVFRGLTEERIHSLLEENKILLVYTIIKSGWKAWNFPNYLVIASWVYTSLLKCLIMATIICTTRTIILLACACTGYRGYSKWTQGVLQAYVNIARCIT